MPALRIVAVGIRSPAGPTARLATLGLRADAVASAVIELANERFAVRPVEPPPPIPPEPEAPTPGEMEEEGAPPEAPVEPFSLVDRLVRLAAPALAEARLGSEAERIPLVLAGPPGLVEGAVPADRLLAIARAAGVAIDAARSAILAGPRASFAAALGQARALLEGNGAPRAVIVGAVDSWLEPARLRTNMTRLRPLEISPRPRGALTASEGAAFLVLERESGAPGGLALIDGPVVRGESADAAGLAPAAAVMFDLLSGVDRVDLVTDSNGERQRERAWSRAVVDAENRLAKRGAAVTHVPLQAELGDADVASPAMQVALVATGLRLGLRDAPRTVVATLMNGHLVAVTLAPAGAPAAAPGVPAGRPSRVAREARGAMRALAGALERFRPAQYRIAPVRRTPLRAALGALWGALQALDEVLVDAGLVALIDGAREAAGAVSREAERTKKSAARRGREPEPVVLELAALATEIGEMLGRGRGTALDELARAPDAAPAGPLGDLPLPLSVGQPARFPWAWRPARVAVELDGEGDPEESDEDDEGLEPAPEPSAPADQGDTAERGVECLESIGRAWRVRTPTPSGAWSPAQVDADERLLVGLDLLFGWAEPLPRRVEAGLLAGMHVDVVPLVRGRPSPLDVGRSFADALVLACATDPRLVRAAVGKARGVHPDVAEAVGDALALGSAPEIGALLAELCLEVDEPTLLLALDVMRRRRVVSLGAATPLLYEPRPAVRLAAGRALGQAKERDAAILALEARLGTETDVTVAAALVEAVVRQRAPHAEAHVARALGDLLALGEQVAEPVREARAVLVRCAAVLGRVQELPAITGLATRPLEIEALGWFGRVTLVDPLVRWLDRTGDEVEAHRRAAARALVRMLGVIPEPAARGVRLVEGNLATVMDDHLCLDPAPWRAYWDQKGTELGVGVRYRFGRRHEPALSASEHVGYGVLHRDRLYTSLELAVAGQPGLEPADERDWASRQLLALGRA